MNDTKRVERSRPPRRAAAERVRGGGVGARLRAWHELHLYSLVGSLGRIGARPWATVLTVGVMALALALPLGLWTALATVERFSGDVRDSREIGVFLEVDVDAAGAAALAAQLARRDDVAGVQLRTPEQGLEELHAMAGLAAGLELLDHNPLPYLVLVEPAGDPEAEDALVVALAALPGVELVQHDAQWRERLGAWLDFGERAAWVVAVLLGLGALLVVGNTVRLDIQGRSEEIAILQQLGATDGFVRRPFLYLGAWYGLAAGLVALLLLAVAGFALRAPLARLAASYGLGFVPERLGPAGFAAVLLGAALLGWVGAWLATGHHLRMSRPTGRQDRGR